jgi:large conductance mechanosensitive channel
LGLWDDFKTFLKQGNIVALAVAFVIGLAFAAVVTAFVGDIVNPIIGIPGHKDFSNDSVTINNSTIKYGAFLNAIIAFVLVAAVIFLAIVRPMAAMEKRRKAREAAAPATTKDCPFCLSKVPIGATRCMYCTSQLPAEAGAATPASGH